MSISNHERVGRALKLLRDGLKSFVEREMKRVYGETWLDQVRKDRDSRGAMRIKEEEPLADVQVILNILWDYWHPVFRDEWGQSERSIISELRDTRNRWAHQEPFSSDDAYRALDSVERLLSAASSPQAQEAARQKQELLRTRFDEQSRKETRRAALTPIEGSPAGGLKPWREVVTPHPDVASGKYQQAEFAADLWQVYKGDGSDEYQNPTEFFRRTFLTEGLSKLLVGALERLSGKGGDPVVELQTNFGGGKTHSMLALYHLFSGKPLSELPGLEPVFQAAGVKEIPAARRVVLVGNKISPGEVHEKSDGTRVRTLWGELAWQLGGREGYQIVRQADESGTNPGDTLRELFKKYAPCLILIDEWVSYARQLHDENDLPAGSFDTHFTFAQTLSEAAKGAPRTMLVVSIPASDNEVGGERGKMALARLKNTIGRVESAWRPASAEEGFEIVRRRLFEPITAPQLFVARDAVVRAFREMYRANPGEFPPECREGDYERRLKAAYPIHPELFDRLYNDWSTLDRFQRTRGVLRLMAAVIHSLWERDDKSLLVLPASVPIDDPQVQSELTRYLDDQWAPVIEKDVDGPHSLPLAIDREQPNLGRYSACRRVARAIYMGSAPTLRAANRGLEERQIKLGCVQPGESAPTFGDALRRLTDKATYLYVDGKRYWYSTLPSVTRLAEDRASQFGDDEVEVELGRWLKEAVSDRGAFSRVHLFPSASSDIPDEHETRLVVLRTEHTHSSRARDSLAQKAATTLLETRGQSPRMYRNTLVFLAPDAKLLPSLETAVRQLLAWESIYEERETLNLNAFQTKQAETKRKEARKTVKLRIPEVFIWLLAPIQEKNKQGFSWDEIKLQSGDSGLAVAASRKLENDGIFTIKYGGAALRLSLDEIPLWRGDHVSTKQLCEDFAQYLYLPKLQGPATLLKAVEDGVALTSWSTDSFAYASGFDEKRGRYVGLVTGRHTSVARSSEALVVKPEAARRQIQAEEEEERRKRAQEEGRGSDIGKGDNTSGKEKEPGKDASSPNKAPEPYKPSQPKRYYGAVSLSTARLGRDAGRIAEEIVQHLTLLEDAQVEVTLEIRAYIPGGAPESVVRTVNENSRTLKFNSYGFEDE